MNKQMMLMMPLMTGFFTLTYASGLRVLSDYEPRGHPAVLSLLQSLRSRRSSGTVSKGSDLTRANAETRAVEGLNQPYGGRSMGGPGLGACGVCF